MRGAQRSHWIETLPKYWTLLNEHDRLQYQALRLLLNPTTQPKGRHEPFEKRLWKIRHYAERGDENDWKRFLVCGICWMDNAIAINTRQLRLLVSKCKSSINGSLQKMGYSTNPSHTESWKGLFPKIPCLKDNFQELRQWTIRYKNVVPLPPPPLLSTPQPPILPEHIACPVKFRAKILGRQEIEASPITNSPIR